METTRLYRGRLNGFSYKETRALLRLQQQHDEEEGIALYEAENRRLDFAYRLAALGIIHEMTESEVPAPETPGNAPAEQHIPSVPPDCV